VIGSVDQYLTDGCGRCYHFQKPSCKVHSWQEELITLRLLVNSTELKEELKWSQPCYTINGKNVIIIASFREYCCINFLKGILIKDDLKLLTKPGENSHTSRMLKFKKTDDSIKLLQQTEIILEYINQAIEIEKSGVKTPEKPKVEEPMPNELLEQFKLVDGLESDFFNLTPGRQRAYLMHFNSAKQSATKTNRITKLIPKIKSGKGPNEY